MKRSLLKVFALLFVLCGFALAQQSVNNAQVAGATTATAASGVQKVGITGATGSALDSTAAGVLDGNIKTINNVTPLMNNGVSGTGSLRVNIASDNTAFAVNATLNAETTKAIGVVRNADGTGNLLTTNSTTFSSKFALDNNLLGTLGTAFSTAGKVDVKAADGDLFVRQTTASNLKVAMSGNAGAVMDFVGQNAAQPANSLLIGGEFNTSPTTITNGNASPLQLDNSGKLLVNCTGCSAASTVTLVPLASGGLTTKHFVAAASDNATNIKASAGQVYSIDVYNNAAYPVYLKLYNASSSPTGCGASNLFKVVGVQSGTQHILQSEQGWALGTGIGYCLTKGITDADDTAVLISDATVDLGYK